MPEKSFEEQTIEDTRNYGQGEIRAKGENFSPQKQVADMIAPSEASDRDLKWVQNNMESIREVVSSGRHEILFYPASGRDFLRVVVGYDVTHLITVDTEPSLKDEIKKQLDTLGVRYEAQEVSHNRTDFIFDLDGKHRTISHLIGDARILTPATTGMKTVDVLHVFLPTGADQEIKADEVYLKEKYGDEWYFKRWDEQAKAAMAADPDAPKPNPSSGEYEVVSPAVPTTLDSRSYQEVNEGGFFVFAERRLQRGSTLPSIYRLAGLKEHQIIRRHPFTVLTSLFPTREEVASMTQEGFVYQKEKAVNPEIIDIVAEVFTSQFWTDYIFMEFERGNFSYAGIKDGEPIDITSTFQASYQELEQTITDFAQRLLTAGANVEDIEVFKNEILADYRQKVEQLKQSAKALLEKYDEVSRKYEAGELDDEGAKREMGVVAERNSVGSMEYINKVYPLAVQLIMGSDEKAAQVEVVLEQLSRAEFQWNQNTGTETNAN